MKSVSPGQLPGLIFSARVLENPMSELRPLPTFLFKHAQRPVFGRRSEQSFYFQLALSFLAAAILAVGAAVAFYKLVAITG